jgi:hypothetical protein
MPSRAEVEAEGEERKHRLEALKARCSEEVGNHGEMGGARGVRQHS